MDEVPEMDAHWPKASRNEMLMCGSEARSSVLPDLVLVWKSRSMPPVSYQKKDRSVSFSTVNEEVLVEKRG
jgi:hypothetical protein